jgi:hypothetical protein
VLSVMAYDPDHLAHAGLEHLQVVFSHSFLRASVTPW